MRECTTNCKKKSTHLKINCDHNYVKKSIYKKVLEGTYIHL